MNNYERFFHKSNKQKKQLKILTEKCTLYKQEIVKLKNILEDIEDYVNFLVILNQTINGKFSETEWGQDILALIGGNDEL